MECDLSILGRLSNLENRCEHNRSRYMRLRITTMVKSADDECEHRSETIPTVLRSALEEALGSERKRADQGAYSDDMYLASAMNASNRSRQSFAVLAVMSTQSTDIFTTNRVKRTCTRTRIRTHVHTHTHTHSHTCVNSAEVKLDHARKALGAAMVGWSDANTRPVMQVCVRVVSVNYDDMYAHTHTHKHTHTYTNTHTHTHTQKHTYTHTHTHTRTQGR